MRADFKDMEFNCGEHNVLLLRVRGSGEKEWHDGLGRWTGAFGSRLVAAGWRVRDRQVQYPAAAVPKVDAPAPQVRKNFLVSMFRSGEHVASQIENAARVCRTRSIVLAGYSQGNAVLRTAFPFLSPTTQRQIKRIVMVSDPSAHAGYDNNVDLGFRRQARRSGIVYSSLARLEAEYVTIAKRPIPPLLEPRTIHYCKHWTDPVCNRDVLSGHPARTLFGALRTHTSYDFNAIGAETAGWFQTVRPVVPARPPMPASPSAQSFRGWIVKWAGETPTPVTSWYVTSEGTRLWIPDGGTYLCLAGRGAPGPALLGARTLDQLPDQREMWAGCGDQLPEKRVLWRGMSLTSSDGRFRLAMQGDGNLVLYGPDGSARWANGRFDTQKVVMQTDGNLVGYAVTGAATWASGTSGTGNRLLVQNDGVLTIRSGDRVVWSSAATPPSPPPPPPPTRRIITVDNRVTNGLGMVEDSTPARLTTQPWVFCGSRGCNINGTERSSGQTYDAAVCQRFGERTTNGNDGSPVDDANPLLFESTRYYGVRLVNGTFGYVSEVWIRLADRGGFGLPAC